MKRNNRNIYFSFLLPGLFSVAMGVLEAVVVIYLRLLYYPMGFAFPLKSLSVELISTEWVREIATVVMLLILGIMSAKDNLQRFFYFLFSFAVWDITYYAALKILIGWPASFLTWDVLFLIPLPWLGPVLAPLICSATMIFFSISCVNLKISYSKFKIKLYEWGIIVTGATIVFVSLILDYFTILSNSGFDTQRAISIFSTFVPTRFNWLIFALGEFFIIYGFVSIIYRTRKKSKYAKKPYARK